MPGDNRFAMFQTPNQSTNFNMDWLNSPPIDSNVNKSVLGGYYGNTPEVAPDNILGDKKINPWVTGMQAFSGLANAYLGNKALDLSQNQFDFTKSSFNKNLANKAQLLNLQMEDQKRARMGATGRYDMNSPEGRASLESDLQSFLSSRKVSGSPI